MSISDIKELMLLAEEISREENIRVTFIKKDVPSSVIHQAEQRYDFERKEGMLHISFGEGNWLTLIEKK